MPAKKYHVSLTPEQRQQVETLACSYKHSALERRRARILLLADADRPGGGCNDQTISREVRVSEVTVQNVRKRFVEGGVRAGLYRKEQHNRKARRLDGDAEAFLVATVCSAPPRGKARWSLHLLAARLVAQGHAEGVSHETVRQALKKTNSSPG